jgi:hypothetical protein
VRSLAIIPWIWIDRAQFSGMPIGLLVYIISMAAHYGRTRIRASHQWCSIHLPVRFIPLVGTVILSFHCTA